jgi:hypothetical protein
MSIIEAVIMAIIYRGGNILGLYLAYIMHEWFGLI